MIDDPKNDCYAQSEIDNLAPGDYTFDTYTAVKSHAKHMMILELNI